VVGDTGIEPARALQRSRGCWFERNRGGRYWDRTSDLFRVREARYRCANRPFAWGVTRCGSCEVATGFEPVYTALQAAASPLGHATVGNRPQLPGAITRADDEIRTRDPHLGKVMRYHCATSAFRDPLPGCIETLAHIFIDGQTGARL